MIGELQANPLEASMAWEKQLLSSVGIAPIDQAMVDLRILGAVFYGLISRVEQNWKASDVELWLGQLSENPQRFENGYTTWVDHFEGRSSALENALFPFAVISFHSIAGGAKFGTIVDEELYSWFNRHYGGTIRVETWTGGTLTDFKGWATIWDPVTRAERVKELLTHSNLQVSRESIWLTRAILDLIRTRRLQSVRLSGAKLLGRYGMIYRGDLESRVNDARIEDGKEPIDFEKNRNDEKAQKSRKAALWTGGLTLLTFGFLGG